MSSRLDSTSSTHGKTTSPSRIGMQDFDPASQKKSADDPTLSKFPAYRVTLTTRDMARIGQLMLQGGKWEGKQVVPADWLKTITSLVTSVNDLNPASGRYQ